jgi:tol-pal system protein YbgF
MARFPRIIAVAALAALSGCATRASVDKLAKEQRDIRTVLADQGVTIDGVRRRLDIIRNDMSEKGGPRGGVTSAQVLQKLNDIEARLQTVEQARGLAPAPAAAGVPTPVTEDLGGGEPVPAPIAAPPARPASPLEESLNKEEAALRDVRVDPDYKEGLALVRQGQCAPAGAKLRDFARRNPKSDLADNAQYWIGACYQSQRQYNQAIRELSDVMLRFPKADKAPAALLMLADAFKDSGDPIDAKLVLKKLLAEHPKSEEAERAKVTLQSLGE